jgi:excisionase family DNA binding protein
MSDKNELLGLQEAAKKLGVKPITLRKWDREGKLKAVRVGPRGDRKYKEEDLKFFLDKSKKEVDWQEYIRSGATYHQIVHPISSCTIGIKKYFGVNIKYFMSYFEKDTLYWYYSKSDLYRFGKKIVEKILSSRKFEENIFKLWNKKSEELLNFVDKNPLEKISLFNKLELAKFYKKFTELIYEAYSISICIDGTDESLMIDVSKKIKSVLKDKYSEKEFINAYNILTTPSELSYLNDERKLLLEIVRDMKNKKLKKNSPEFNKRVQDILDVFWWTALGWAEEEPKKTQDIIRDINNTIKSKINVEKELEDIKNYSKRTTQTKEDLEKKYDFAKDKELSELLRLVDRLFVYHDYRKETQVKPIFYEYKILNLISKITKIPTYLLEWCDPKEIIDILKTGKFDEKEINQRKSHFLYVHYNGKITKLSGKKAAREHKRILSFELEETRDLQGLSACPGKVVGEAFVALTTDSASKIKKGQILVTGMTTPDYVPAMKKAAGLVTDEGGITCHAAIVSRELQIPCIISTKTATRLIKTGDIIEVLANHGVVRILKK